MRTFLASSLQDSGSVIDIQPNSNCQHVGGFRAGIPPPTLIDGVRASQVITPLHFDFKSPLHGGVSLLHFKGDGLDLSSPSSVVKMLLPS
jgi:hypothetical protein